MSGAVPLLTQYAFMEWYSVKAQGQLYLYLYLYFMTSVNNLRIIQWKPTVILLDYFNKLGVEDLNELSRLSYFTFFWCITQ